MSQIPSDIAASASQAGFQAREVSKDRDARRAAESSAADHQIKSLAQAGSTVDTEDADVAVFSDSEGGGSQGRETADESATASEDTPVNDKGITKDGDGRLHVDLEA